MVAEGERDGRSRGEGVRREGKPVKGRDVTCVGSLGGGNGR